MYHIIVTVGKDIAVYDFSTEEEVKKFLDKSVKVLDDNKTNYTINVTKHLELIYNDF